MIFTRSLNKTGDKGKSRSVVLPKELLEHWAKRYFQEITAVEIDIEGDNVVIRPQVPDELRRLVSA